MVEYRRYASSIIVGARFLVLYEMAAARTSVPTPKEQSKGQILDIRRSKRNQSGAGYSPPAPVCQTAPPPFTVYYGLRRFLLVAQSFSLDRRKHPYHRLSATLILARKTPVQLRVGGDQTVTGRALLIAPGVERQHISGANSEVAIFDVSIGTPEFSALHATLIPDNVRILDARRFESLEPLMVTAFQHHLSEPEAASLFASAIALAGSKEGHHDLDPRVRRAIDIIDQLPFDELSPESLAAQVGLSASRLRHLFREQLGCALTQYQRWSATWKAAVLMTESDNLTRLAHQMGFYDLAHFDHAFIDIFGLPPSELLDPNRAVLVRCL